MSEPVHLNRVSTVSDKPGGEGGTPGIVEESIERVHLTAVSTILDKPGGEGGTPGIDEAKAEQ